MQHSRKYRVFLNITSLYKAKDLKYKMQISKLNFYLCML